jgi:sensor histidine kinase YesM
MSQAIELSNNFGKNEERLELLLKEQELADQAIALLQQDQQLKGNQIFNRNLVIGVLIFCLLGLFAGGFVVIRNNQARRRADKLLALQSMSGQMNPHFIFNALNSVNEYISQNDERAANRYLSSFSKLMRQVMDDSKHTFIPLSEEISMLRLYLELEHSRFKDQFEYQFQVDSSIEHSDFEIPPMMVQPFIENAIWHGLRYRKGKGHLLVHFSKNDETVEITISDDGIGLSKSKELKTQHQKKQNSLGMKNIHTRLALMNEIYHTNMRVEMSESNPGDEFPGLKVQIYIPQHKISESNKT